ncbi:MAG: tRNA (adenosine(37)-N6)-threonylcarbamoyltransferase complex dimerization subunit type 1 TsaB [Dehalococcoidia bacterium]|nr:tRNA (adenosine(37)-N6)-threonylcarbamoyltransferase complex dimerization subunit type 1 TsaB [Dehalococcoidia bacterium]
MELILDASSRASRVGLSAEGRLKWRSDALEPQEHTRELIPAVLRGMTQLAASFTDLELIVVALGPGPFNGLRVAVSTAKGLAEGTGALLAGVPTLEAEVNRCQPAEGLFRPVVAAGRANFTTALFSCSDCRWNQTGDVSHMNVAELARVASDREVLCGEVEEFRQALRSAGLDRTFSIAVEQATRLEALARLGWERFRAGVVIPAGTLQPLYVNPPHITTPRDRRP